jgi:hypothetical protein
METLGGVESFNATQKSESRLETMLSTTLLSSAPHGVLKDLRSQFGQSQVERRSLKQANPELVLEFSNPAANGGDHILRRRAASEKLPPSTTFANKTSELRSAPI